MFWSQSISEAPSNHVVIDPTRITLLSATLMELRKNKGAESGAELVQFSFLIGRYDKIIDDRVIEVIRWDGGIDGEAKKNLVSHI